MFNRTRTSLIVLTAILLLSVLTVHVHASDDANSNSLTPTRNTTTPTQTTNQTMKIIDQLTQNLNNTKATTGPSPGNQTQLIQLKNQLENQLRNGNNTGAQQTLDQMSQYTKSPQGQGLSPLLRDTIQSMKIDSNGLSLDTSLLRSLIGQPGSNGMPTGLAGMDPSTAASQLRAMSSLIGSIDPQTALSLLQLSEELQNSVNGGLFPGAGDTSNLQTPTLPNIGNIPNPLGGPHNVGGGTPSLPSLAPVTPTIPTSMGDFGVPILAIIAVAIAAVAGYFILTKSELQSVAKPKILGVIKKKTARPGEGPIPTGARELVAYYFRKMVGTMRERGVNKLDPDTHREFSDMCTPLPEAPPVRNISVLYEKAIFSGREVTMPDVNEASGYVSQVENVLPPVHQPKSHKSLAARILHLG